TILTENIDVLHNMAKALMKWETIDRSQIDDLMAGREPKPLPDINSGSGSKTDYTGQDQGNKPNLVKPAGQL
ncbi:MAG: cell division protein FtsH, partial [Methylococcaceae bacterium]|nr:cell division protein FtsH [Methylococcaceae bacterium]